MESFGTLAGPYFQKLFILLVGVFTLAYGVYRLQRRLRRGRRLVGQQQLDRPADIHAVLREAVRQRNRILVRFNDRRRSFTSFPLQLTRSRLVIDALFPVEGNVLVEYASSLQVEFMMHETGAERQQIPYEFTTHFVAKKRFRKYPAIVLALTTLIRPNPRRQYLRVEPVLASPVTITFQLDEEVCVERVANISGGGIGFYSTITRSRLGHGARIMRAMLTFPDGSEIECDLAIHLAVQQEQPVLIDARACHTYYGAEFVGMKPVVREGIVQYVLSRERQELKRLSGV